MKKWTKKLVSAVLAVGMAAVLLTGCGQKTDSGSGKKAANQHIKAALAWMPPNIDPADESNGWVTVRSGITECLVKLNDEVKPEMWLASDVKNVDDTTWEITIKDNVKFSNGTAVDAEAVKKCFERTISKSEQAKDYAKVASMEANGQKLTVKTTEPNAAFLTNLIDPVFSIYDATQSDADIAKGVIGTGPFVVTSMVPEQSMELKRNDNYWDGEVGLETVSLTYVSEAEARTMALQSGELDLVTNIDLKNKRTLEGAGNFNIDTKENLRVAVARMYVEGRPLQDVELRKAVSYAADREAYAKLVGGTAAHSLYTDVTPFGNDKINAITYDKQKAVEILDAAGYKDVNGDGIREDKNGNPLKLVFLQSASFGSGDMAMLGTAFKDSLKEVGIELDLQTMEGGHSSPDVPYDFYTRNDNGAPTGDPAFYLRKLYSQSKSNEGNFKSAKVDEVLGKFKTTFDMNERYKLAQEATQILNDEAADLFLTNGAFTTVSAKKVKNAKQPVCDFYFLNKDIFVEE